MNKATNIKIISNEACQKLIKECEKENKLLDAKIKTLEKKKDKIKAILDSSKINDKKAYKLFKKQAVVYTRIKKAINNSKAKHISNQYYIKWLSLNNVSKNKNNEYIFAKNLYEFSLYVESDKSEQIFPYSYSKLQKLNHYEGVYSKQRLKLEYLKNVVLRTLESEHKPTWSVKDDIKKTTETIKNAERKINDIKETFANRYLAILVKKLEKAKKNPNAIADVQKLRAEQQAAREDAKKLDAEYDSKKKELKATIDKEIEKLSTKFQNKQISANEYKTEKSKLIDTYHEDIKIMNRIIKDAFYNVNNYSDFDKCENVVELKDVVKYYNNGYIATKVLDHVNLKIKKGEFVVILGPSGSGKTTLLNIISGMDNATYGEVLIANENLIDYDQTQLTTFRRRNIGYVFQQYGLLPNLTVKENIQMGQNLQSNKAKILDIEMILESIGLISQINKYPNELSGGQQQRVSIARSIAKNPNILFGDEPTGAIDVEMSKEIMRLFTEVNNRFKTTIIIVTHNPIIAELATMVIHVANGTISKIVKNEHPKTVDDLDWATVVKNKK